MMGGMVHFDVLERGRADNDGDAWVSSFGTWATGAPRADGMFKPLTALVDE